MRQIHSLTVNFNVMRVQLICLLKVKRESFYWVARPLGSSFGDYLSQPSDEMAMNWVRRESDKNLSIVGGFNCVNRGFCIEKQPNLHTR